MTGSARPVRASWVARVVLRTAVLVGCVVGRAVRADDGARDPHAFVEVVAPRAVLFVGEVVPLRVRVGVDASRVATDLVPLVRQRLDVPLHVEVPVLRARPGLTILPGASDPAARTVTLALNDDVVAAIRAPDRVSAGVTCAVFEVERRVVVDAAGALDALPPSLRFAVATRFHDDLVRGRVPLDRRDVTVTGVPTALRFDDLPATGRPEGFTGAIGRFTVAATADAAVVEVGRPFRVTLRVAGPGNLARVAPPRLARLDGFHVFGALDRLAPDERSVVFEVAAVRGDVVAFPPVPFAAFDPTPPAGYRVLTTSPIPLTVRGADGATGREARAPDATTPSPRTTGALLVVLGAGVVAAVVLRRRRAARRAAAADPARAAVAAAVAGFRAAEAADPLDPLVAVLAAHLRVPTAAVIAPGLASRLEAAGLPAGDAHATAALVEVLVGARYGGTAPPDASARAAAAVAAVEAVQRARASG